MRHFTGYCVTIGMRHYTGYDVTDKKLKVTFHTGFFDVAAIAEGVASIVIGQAGGACSV